MIKVVCAVVALVAGAWVGVWELSPKANGHVELVLKASGRARVYLWANRRAKVAKNNKERPAFVVGPSEFRQVVVFPLKTRLVEELSVEFQELDPGGVEFFAVKLFDSTGKQRWASDSPGPVWELPQRESLSKDLARDGVRWWLVGVAVFLCLVGAMGIAYWVWIWGSVKPGIAGYGLGIVGGFVCSGAAYFGLIHLTMDHLWADNWVHNVLVKKRVALLLAESPKTLVIGGSSGLFGVKAELLAEESGAHVVNYATHAGIPFDYYLDVSRQHLNPGDECIIHLEHTKWVSDNVTTWILDQAMAWGRRQSPPQILKLTPERMLAAMPPETLLAGGVMALYPRAFSPVGPTRIELPDGETETMYGGLNLGITTHGDLIFSTLTKSPARPVPDTYIPKERFDCEAAPVKKIESFLAWAAANQIRVYFAFPPVIQHEMTDFRKPEFRIWIDPMLEWIRTHGGVPLGRPEDYAQPFEAFLDTNYHLTEQGRDLHTRRILQQLQAAGWPGR